MPQMLMLKNCSDVPLSETCSFSVKQH